MHWLQEKVLLAERALLYSFAFDFRTGDPYSFALKYNSTLRIMSAEDGEQALSWLGRAGIVTTLCLQYPSSTLAVVALWFAQHVTHGEVRLKLLNATCVVVLLTLWTKVLIGLQEMNKLE